MIRRRRKPPKQFFPASIADEYAAAIKHRAVAVLLAVSRDRLLKRVRVDDLVIRLDDTISKQLLKELIHDAEVEYGYRFSDVAFDELARRMLGRTSQFNKRQTSIALQAAAGRNLIETQALIDQEMKSVVVDNVALIKSIGDDYFSQLREMIPKAAETGDPYNSISKTIQERYEVAESRADLIAQDQIGKWNGQLSALRQTASGIEEYIWRTCQDDRVREEHAANDGKTFAWDSPPPLTGHPGEDIRCRCWAEPKVTGIIYEDGVATQAQAAISESSLSDVSPSLSIPEPSLPQTYEERLQSFGIENRPGLSREEGINIGKSLASQLEQMGYGANASQAMTTDSVYIRVTSPDILVATGTPLETDSVTIRIANHAPNERRLIEQTHLAMLDGDPALKLARAQQAIDSVPGLIEKHNAEVNQWMQSQAAREAERKAFNESILGKLKNEARMPIELEKWLADVQAKFASEYSAETADEMALTAFKDRYGVVDKGGMGKAWGKIKK